MERVKRKDCTMILDHGVVLWRRPGNLYYSFILDSLGGRGYRPDDHPTTAWRDPTEEEWGDL